MAIQQLQVGVADPFAPAAKAHPALRVAPDALDQLAGRLTAKSAPVHWDESLPAVRRFFTEGPWGNRLELPAAPG